MLFIVQNNMVCLKRTITFESNVNSAWVVSQYANEYNPLHNHTGCEISGVYI